MDAIRFLIAIGTADRQYRVECSIDHCWPGILPIGSQVKLTSTRFPVASQVLSYSWDTDDARVLICRLASILVPGNRDDIQLFLDGFHETCKAKIVREVP